MNSNNADRTVRIGRFLRRLCFAVMLILAIASFMHFGATGHVPKSAQQRLLCQNNLKQIGLALQNYLSSEGSFPPAYVVDSAGRPVHSWRVLLLPYFDGREADVVRNKLLYEAYRFDEPWDGPNNSRLVQEIPTVYECPTDKNRTKGSTNYQAIVGEKTAWPLAVAVMAQQIKDGLSNTIMVVETKGQAIPWTSPRDLEFDKMDFVINSFSGYGLASDHRDCANVLMADGSSKTLKNDVPRDMVRAMATRDGGEIVILP